MAGSSFPKTPASPSTTPETTGPDARRDRDAQLKGLLERVRSRTARVAAPARSLALEVDGEVIAEADVAMETRVFDMPTDARSLTLRDEDGCPRAHVLLDGEQQQAPAGLTYDNGRIELTLERNDDSLSLLVRCHEVRATEASSP